MKLVVVFCSLILIIGVLIASVAVIDKQDENPEKHLEIVLRDIGHQILLTGKDSSSRVLPIRRVNKNTYQISFQNSFTFVSDTLISLFEREFQKNALAKDYIVNLRSCEQKETVFAFEMNSKTGNLTPCKGRRLGVGCYVIEVDLLKSNTFNSSWLFLLIIPLTVGGFYIKDKLWKKPAKESIIDDGDYITFGNFRFYPGNNMLRIENKSISLSDKETKALKIFAENINQIVEREKMMKEIWGDEGIVVISKNVDVLVSKLRKKLSADSSIKVVNVHGRGYRVIIE